MSIPLQVDPMSTLPWVLGCRKESGGWERETARTEAQELPRALHPRCQC